MGKHEPMTAKAIANRIKAKGLQKIKYYCEMCKKQCRDDNGFKCHIMSESHQRQALIVCENPEKFVSQFSKEFMDGFLYILKTRYRTEKVLANTVFQEYIKERDHIHMNGTRWTSLTEFANWLGENGIVTVTESERGVMITYIDKDPETLRRQELEEKRALQAQEAAKRVDEEIARQMEDAKKLMRSLEPEKKEAKPIPIVKIASEKDQPTSINNDTDPQPSTSDLDYETTSDSTERPLFNVQTITLKTTAPSSYKPPPPKRKVTGSKLKKKMRAS